MADLLAICSAVIIKGSVSFIWSYVFGHVMAVASHSLSCVLLFDAVQPVDCGLLELLAI